MLLRQLLALASLVGFASASTTTSSTSTTTTTTTVTVTTTTTTTGPSTTTTTVTQGPTTTTTTVTQGPTTTTTVGPTTTAAATPTTTAAPTVTTTAAVTATTTPLPTTNGDVTLDYQAVATLTVNKTNMDCGPIAASVSIGPLAVCKAVFDRLSVDTGGATVGFCSGSISSQTAGTVCVAGDSTLTVAQAITGLTGTITGDTMSVDHANGGCLFKCGARRGLKEEGIAPVNIRGRFLSTESVQVTSKQKIQSKGALTTAALNTAKTAVDGNTAQALTDVTNALKGNGALGIPMSTAAVQGKISSSVTTIDNNSFGNVVSGLPSPTIAAGTGSASVATSSSGSGGAAAAVTSGAMTNTAVSALAAMSVAALFF